MEKSESNIKISNQQLIEKCEKSKLTKTLGLPEKITWTNTLKCNLGCSMCPTDRKESYYIKQIKLGDLIDLSKYFFPTLKTLNLTRRGEPFADSNLNKIMDLAESYNVKVDINTNGLDMNRNWVERYIRSLIDVKVSIDSINPETFRRIRGGAKIAPILKNIRDFVKIKEKVAETGEAVPKISFEFTISKINAGELPQIISKASEIGVDCVKAYHMFAFWSGQEKISMFKYKQTYNEIYYETKDKAKVEGIELRIALPFLIDGEPPKFKNRNCPRLWRRLWIDINGEVLPCLHPQRRVIGNIFQDNLIEIWNGKEYQFLRSGKDPMCKICGWLKISDRKSPIPYDDLFFLKTWWFYQEYASGNNPVEKTIGGNWDALWSRRTGQMPPNQNVWG